MARIAWLRGFWGLGLCFATGCLYHSTTGGDAVPQVRAIAEQPPPLDRPEPPPVLPEKIAPYKVRPASAIEPPPQEAPPAATPSAVPVPRFVELPPPEMPPKDKPLVAAMRQMLLRHPEAAARELGKAGAKRERLLALLKLTTGVSEDQIDRLPPGEAAQLLDHLRLTSQALARRAPLELRKTAYCRSICGFGQFEPAGPAPSFQAGAEGQPGEAVQVYAEVANFSSRCADAGHETCLAASLEIRGKDGQRLATLPLGSCADHCRSRRQDYFLNCRFHVPAGLKPGDHVLWVTVRDATPGGKPREARSSLPFRVVPRIR